MPYKWERWLSNGLKSLQSGQASLASVQPGMLRSGPGHCREQGQVPGRQKGPQGQTAVKMLSGGGAGGEQDFR